MSPIAFLVFSFSLFILPLIAESVTSWRAIRTAQHRFPELWVHSGSPSLIGNGDLLKAWPLVKYYRDRVFLSQVQYGNTVLPPVADGEALAFAERLRGPLVWTYWAAWIGAAAFLLVLIVGGVIFY